MKTAAPLGIAVALLALSACGEPAMEQRLTPPGQNTGDDTRTVDPTTGGMNVPLPEAGLEVVPDDGGQRPLPEDGTQPSTQVAPPGFEPAPEPPPRE